eukprot:scaffold141557_cov64-Attheya_sp.AAC.1
MFFGRGGTSFAADILNQLLEIGGVKCDYPSCQKHHFQVGIKLFKCQKCQRAFYCSKECQKKQWREGNHKLYCRDAHMFEAGDLVLLNGLKSKPEFNQRIVSVVGSVPGTDGGRFEVNIVGHDGSMSIAVKNLNHLRPFDVVAVE